jgi:hypothetical protein
MAVVVEHWTHHPDAELMQVVWALCVELGYEVWLGQGGIAEGTSSMCHSDAR